MIDKKFRRLMMDCPQVVPDSVLTDKEVQIARLIHTLAEPVFSREVARHLGISVQSASTQLKRVAEKGYATRREVKSHSGGIEIEYWPTLNGEDKS